MAVLRNVNLALSFLLELCMLAALGYWGFQTGSHLATKIVLAIGAPLVVAVIWGIFVAPKAIVPVSAPVHLLFQLVLFGLAIATLAQHDHTTMAWIFALVLAVNLALAFVWQQ